MQDELLRRHGFRNASSSFGLKSWGILPLETLIRNPPEVIFMPVNADGREDRAMAGRVQLINNLRKKTRIVNFPDRLLYCGGPTTIKVSKKLVKAREDILATQQKGAP
jgi:iron complex transport system substrate-binding protein